MKTSLTMLNRLVLPVLIGTLSIQTAHAALLDISNTPLASSGNDQAKPNILFVLDDSGSMDSDDMPDNLGTSTVGYRNFSCNYVYFNPNIQYEIPENHNGTPLNNTSQTSFTSAFNNGYDSFTGTSSGTTNLSTSFATGNDTANGWSQNGYHWTLNDPTGVTSGTTLSPANAACNITLTSSTTSTTGICCDTRADKNYATCSNKTYTTTSPASCTAGKTLVWKKISVSSTSSPSAGDERQNFANWYSYYRTRLMMMKASTAQAFSTVSDAYRVGFLTINPTNLTTKFLKVSDFNSTQRQNWYTKLFSQRTNGSTPLRKALSIAGRYFAGKNDGVNTGMIPSQTDDPVQYSCQQNFAILTTDGYWNGDNGVALDGTNLGTNQDGDISELDAYNPDGQKFLVSPRPIQDGGTTTYVWNTASNTYSLASCVFGTQNQERVTQFQTCSSTSTNQTQTRTSSNSGDTWTSWSNVATCVLDTSGSNRRDCRNGQQQARYSSDSGNSWTDWTNVSSCSFDTTGSSRTDCRYATTYSCSGSWTNGQCTNTDPTQLPVCRSNTGAWTNVASCTASSQNGSGVATECQVVNINGQKIRYASTITSRTYPGPNRTGSQIGSTVTSTASGDLDGTCYNTTPSLPSNGTVTGGGPPTPPNNCISGLQEWPCETTSSAGGSTETLADIAQYYYKTDLRPGNLSVPTTDSLYGTCAGSGALGGTVDVCRNNVPPSGTGPEDDKATWQHMTTFTMGLGLSGTLSFSPSYKTDTTGTFQNIRAGTTNWPIPSANSATALDDLWHAAVNGRGQYFSARDPNSVVEGITSALAGISARTAAAAAAATSNLEPVAGDNYAYIAKYVTQQWTGELEAKQINLETGVIEGLPIWQATAKLDAKGGSSCDTRTIKLFRSGATNNLVDFKWNTYACDTAGNQTGSSVTTLDTTEQSYFGSSQVMLLGQYPNMSDGSGGTVDQRALAAGANLVNYLRGQRGKEGFVSLPTPTTNNANKLYRAREHILGDIVNSQPVFVKSPFAEYTDAGYSTYKNNQATRTPMVYVAANDGMLHAFYAGTSTADANGGVEAWAIMPTMALPNLYKMASESYSSEHQFFVDGTPTAADIYDPSTSADCALSSPANPGNCWKTILIGGVNKGGQGYYAVDITDPATPKALWEFKQSSTCYDAANSATYGADCKIGYTYGKPIVGKLADGTWAVIVTSGYNNSDGIGYLYVLNPMTGRIRYRISTGVGSSTTPSGLGQIAGWVSNADQNNTIERVYGTDLLGNIWRFDINDTIAPSGREATRVAQVLDPSGNPQPITTKPRLAEVGSDPFVYVGTGKYLGVTDKSDTQVQTIWAIKDPMTTTAVTNLRSTLGNRTIVNNGTGLSAYRTVTTSSCQPGEGWYADLPDSGERINIDMQLQLGTLVAATNVPSPNACNIGGYSWLNFFNSKTGCAVAGSANGSVGVRLVGSTGVESLVVGINVIRLPDGKTKIVATTSGAEQITQSGAFSTPSPTGKRVSWREIVQ